MADISAKITRQSIKAKKKAAIRTIKAQAKEKIKEVKLEYANNPERKKAREEEREKKKALKIQKANARLAYNARQPRQFSLGEDIVNSLLGGIGAGLSVAALVLLVIRGVFYTPENFSTARIITSFSIFASSLIILYLLTTLYHAIQSLYARKIFSILNHCAIYYLIAGTYTPFVLAKIPGNSGFAVAIFVWIVTGVLILLYAVLGSKMRGFSIFSYLVLGWLIVTTFSFYPLGSELSKLSRAMLFAGGASYTIGGLFFLLRKYKWTRTIFYVFAIAGSVLHFFSVYFLI